LFYGKIENGMVYIKGEEGRTPYGL
jgi:hypothetical protein